MQVISLKCPSCGATFDIDSNRECCFCTYCGNKILLKNDEIVHRYIDEAKLKELDNQQKSQEAYREFAENKNKNDFRMKLILLVVWLVVVIALLIVSIITADNVGFSPYQLVLFPVFIIGIVKLFKK